MDSEETKNLQIIKGINEISNPHHFCTDFANPSGNSFKFQNKDNMIFEWYNFWNTDDSLIAYSILPVKLKFTMSLE